MQVVSRLVDITAGGDMLGLCEQKVHINVSDYGRLQSYVHFLIPVHSFVWTVLREQLPGYILNLVAYR